MEKTKEQIMDEAATGMCQHGELVYCNDGMDKITKEQAMALLKNNEDIVIKAAGAGNHREVFTTLGFQEVECIIAMDSDGTCSFGVKNEQGWFVGQQEPVGYNGDGYRYLISPLVECCETLEKLNDAVADFIKNN
jgi:hypothetical protein